MKTVGALAIHDELYPLALSIGGAVEMSALAFVRVAQKLSEAGKPVRELTMGEAADLIEAARAEFNADWQRWEQGK